MRRTLLSLSLLLLTLSPTANAQTVSVPNTFTNGTVADADQVNANFTALETGVNTALANRATDCAGAGGTWEAGTSTCTPAYNCFIGAFCAQAANDFPPATYGYTNVYDGHTQGTEPALGAGCSTSPDSIVLWFDGEDIARWIYTAYLLDEDGSLGHPFSSWLTCASNWEFPIR